MRNLLLFLLLGILAACGLVEEATETPEGTLLPGITPEAVLAETPVLDGTAPAPSLAETPGIVAPVPSATVTLRLWTNTDIAPRSEIPGGTVLLENLNAFDQSHPNVTLYVELKTITDQGGSLSYLRTGRTVAPSILPDLILLPTGYVAEAARTELIYPITDLVPAPLLEDLYPVARELVMVDDEIYAYPFALTGLKHLVYNQETITNTLATDWPGLLEQGEERSLVFPAAGPAGAEWTLQLYLAAGGRLRNDTGQTTLEVEPLTVALEQIAQAVDNNLILPQSGNIASIDQAWQIYQNSTANMVETTAGNFLQQQTATGLPTTWRFAPLPSPSGPLAPLVSGWTWAVSTPDPVRQALAVELITSLVAPEQLAAWSWQSRMVPAQANALALWPEETAYIEFLRQQLAAARPFPPGATNALLLALANATADVILELNTPAAAAEEAVATVLNP